MHGSTLIFLLLCAFTGHRYSTRYGILRGTTPWHIPSLLWGFLCFVTGPFGLMLEFVAVRTTKPASLSLPTGDALDPAWMPIAASDIDPGGASSTTGFPAANDGSGKMALFGWYPDPTGRHERRYWDGKGWTSQIEDHLVTGVDPL